MGTHPQLFKLVHYVTHTSIGKRGWPSGWCYLAIILTVIYINSTDYVLFCFCFWYFVQCDLHLDRVFRDVTKVIAVRLLQLLHVTAFFHVRKRYPCQPAERIIFFEVAAWRLPSVNVLKIGQNCDNLGLKLGRAGHRLIFSSFLNKTFKICEKTSLLLSLRTSFFSEGANCW